MLPIDIIELYLYEIPFEFILAGKKIVEYLDVSVVRKSEVPYSSGLSFGEEEIEDPVINVTGVEFL